MAQANATGDPAKALTSLNQAYTHASAQIQQRILAQGGVQTILKNAAALQMKPLTGVGNSKDPMQELFALKTSLDSLEKSAAQLDPTLAAGLVNQALPALNQFNTQYAKQYGGAGIGSDSLHAGPITVATVMDLSEHIAGPPKATRTSRPLPKSASGITTT